jgi:hypothetical protein
VTIRPLPFARWIAPIILAALVAIILSVLVRGSTVSQVLQGWPLLLLAATSALSAVLISTLYIRVDDSTVVAGTLLTTRRYDRREFVRIRSTRSPVSNLAQFLRQDGSVLFTTSGSVWGDEQLNNLATFLNVPLDA